MAPVLGMACNQHLKTWLPTPVTIVTSKLAMTWEELRPRQRYTPTSGTAGQLISMDQARHLDAAEELGEDDKVEDDGRGEQGVLAGVVHHDGLAAAQEDLAAVLVHGALAVRHVGDVLDDHAVIRVLPGRIQQRVARYHVVHLTYEDAPLSHAHPVHCDLLHVNRRCL